MAPKCHPTPLSGGDRKALAKELGKAGAMATILAAQSAEMRAKGEAIIQQADRLLCESWNERMWSDGDTRTAFPPNIGSRRPYSVGARWGWFSSTQPRPWQTGQFGLIMRRATACTCGKHRWRCWLA